MSCEDRTQGKYKGVRQRKWGKWVSEIRVPGTKHRLWLGSYATPEAAAVAHDVAYYSLHKPSTTNKLNFPLMIFPSSVFEDMSPRSVPKAASDAGMAIDARFIASNGKGDDEDVINIGSNHCLETENWEDAGGNNCGSTCEETGLTHHKEPLSISVNDYI